MATKNTQSWQQAAESARQYCENTITRVEPPVPGVPNALPLNVTRIPNELLSPREVLITELPPERLLEELSSGRLRSVEVTTAYLRRAGIAHRLVSPPDILVLFMLGISLTVNAYDRQTV